MTGETDLPRLLMAMSPMLDDTEWVFAVVTESKLEECLPQAIASFREQEGVTLVLPTDSIGVSKGLFEHVSAPMARITLQVHSSLHAVGLTAAVANALAERGISTNVVAAYFHDHIFVPVSARFRALDCLNALASSHDLG